MKKIILAAAVVGLAGAGASTAHAGGIRFSFGIPAPVVAISAPARVYVAAPAVVCAPAPVVVYATRRYGAPARRVFCPPVPGGSVWF